MEKCFVNDIFNLLLLSVSAWLRFYFSTVHLVLQESLVLVLKGHGVYAGGRVAVQQFTLQRDRRQCTTGHSTP